MSSNATVAATTPAHPTNGLEIATPAPRTPQRRASGAPARRPAPARTASRTSPPRSRRQPAPPYRPNYWLVALVALAVGGLGIAFLMSVAILWSLAGPLITGVMVAAYAFVMYRLWRYGVSRL